MTEQTRWFQWMALPVAAAGCLLPCACVRPRTGLEQLESEDPGRRIAAIVDLTEQVTKNAPSAPTASDLIPRLVDRLEDDDEGVRFYAILGLEKLTGTRRGYRYGDPIDQRRAAVDRWRAFVAGGAKPGPPASVHAEEMSNAGSRGDGHR